ncbi:MAG: NUDIX domain-containing protein [Patescibacteria group bacterium]|nr:NUDIX domain-containing protein [Patescibacteria group bacterium]
MAERYKLSSDVQLMLIKDDKILLLKRQNTGYMDGQYGLPAGHLESEESLVSAMIREAKEEAGLELKPEDLVFSQSMHRKSTPDYLTFFFTVENYQGPEPQNTEPEKCSELNWFALDNLPENTIYWVKIGIANYQNGIKFSEPDF